MSYQQLTEGKRYKISALLAQGFSASTIQRNRSPSRHVYREMKRNSHNGNYEADKAQALTCCRRAQARKYRVPQQTVMYVELTLPWYWSPEQISCIGKRIGLPVSHEWIHRRVSADELRGGALYKALPLGHKRYRRVRKSKRAVITKSRSIEERPAIVETRECFDDWDVDNMLVKHDTGGLVTLAERNSR